MHCHHLVAESFSVGAPEFGLPQVTVIDPSAVFTPQTVKNAKAAVAFLGTPQVTGLIALAIALANLIFQILRGK